MSCSVFSVVLVVRFLLVVRCVLVVLFVRGHAVPPPSSSMISPVAVFTAGAAGAAWARATTTASAVFRPMPGTSQICSIVACRSRFTEPKCLINACFRVSPRPGTASSGLVRMRFVRLDRW